MPPQWAFFALFAGFTATMTRSDFSCPSNTRCVSRRREHETAEDLFVNSLWAIITCLLRARDRF
jgi:hypothetical protein